MIKSITLENENMINSLNHELVLSFFLLSHNKMLYNIEYEYSPKTKPEHEIETIHSTHLAKCQVISLNLFSILRSHQFTI